MKFMKLMAIVREFGEDGDRMTTKTTLMRHDIVVGGGDLWQIMNMSFLNLMTWWNPLMIHIAHTTQHALVTMFSHALTQHLCNRSLETIVWHCMILRSTRGVDRLRAVAEHTTVSLHMQRGRCTLE